MWLRSILVVLSLLALSAGPVEASRQRQTRKQKTAAQKRAAASAKKKAAEKPTDGAGTAGIGDTRKNAAATHTPRQEPAKRTTGAPVVKTTRVAARRTTTTSRERQTDSPSAGPAVATTPRPAYDSSAAVAPRRKGGRVRRFLAGVAVVAALSLGAVGWQSADMNGKVSDAWNYVQAQVVDIFDGGQGGHDDPTGGKPNKGDPPFPDPGPPIPEPEPDPDPSPSGGQGKQTPKGPETDRR